jgi:hypothetical protein
MPSYKVFKGQPSKFSSIVKEDSKISNDFSFYENVEFICRDDGNGGVGTTDTFYSVPEGKTLYVLSVYMQICKEDAIAGGYGSLVFDDNVILSLNGRVLSNESSFLTFNFQTPYPIKNQVQLYNDTASWSSYAGFAGYLVQNNLNVIKPVQDLGGLPAESEGTGAPVGGISGGEIGGQSGQ